MDKRVVLAVAGAGKTTYIVDRLSLEKRSLIVTYTTNNTANLRAKIISKFGYFPENIKLLPFFTFLYSFCYRPILSYSFASQGLTFHSPPRFIAKTNPLFFKSHNDYIYSNRLTLLMMEHGLIPKISERINKYFDEFVVDEVQDIGGRDFNFMMDLVGNVPSLLVGDFYQHTYNTSFDGRVNVHLYSDVESYKDSLRNAGLTVDVTTLNKSYRCAPATCEYIASELGIHIQSHRDDDVQVKFIDGAEDIRRLFEDNSVVKLFYNKHYEYSCNSRNWGDCKGEDTCQDVCIALNATTLKAMKKNKLSGLAPITKNKLYVAISRARGNVYFVDEQMLKSAN
jgi:DNA helicase-2/ATP-dependent DNA helicase PcrA